MTGAKLAKSIGPSNLSCAPATEFVWDVVLHGANLSLPPHASASDPSKSSSSSPVSTGIVAGMGGAGGVVGSLAAAFECSGVAELGYLASTAGLLSPLLPTVSTTSTTPGAPCAKPAASSRLAIHGSCSAFFKRATTCCSTCCRDGRRPPHTCTCSVDAADLFPLHISLASVPQGCVCVTSHLRLEFCQVRIRNPPEHSCVDTLKIFLQLECPLFFNRFCLGTLQGILAFWRWSSSFFV